MTSQSHHRRRETCSRRWAATIALSIYAYVSASTSTSTSISPPLRTVVVALSPPSARRRPPRAAADASISSSSRTPTDYFSDHSSLETKPSTSNVLRHRRAFLGEFGGGIIIGIPVVGSVFSFSVMTAEAANLPKSTGADLGKTGKAETLARIVMMRSALINARNVLFQTREGSHSGESDSPSVSSSSSSSSDELIATLSKILTDSVVPSDETSFKRMFDRFSDPVSYKQRFMDQNAFLVYYTGGYDGPNRPRLEDDGGKVPKQTLQYGFRNDAWSSYEDVLAEIQFAKRVSSGGGTEDDVSTIVDDILPPLDRTISAVENYINLAPPSIVQEARKLN